MKHECNVARDLMPLVLDNAASEESNQLLTEHLEECDACRECFGGMKAALPIAAKENSEQEQKAFDTAAHKARKKRRRRIWRNVLIGVLIGFVVMYGCVWTWSNMMNKFDVPVFHGEYNVFLTQLQDGSVSVNVDYLDSTRQMMISLEERQENGEQIFYICGKTSRIGTRVNQPMGIDSCTRLSAEDLEYFSEIREGEPFEYAVVWEKGDNIPAASEEMEIYFALLDQLDAIAFVETDDGKLKTLTFEDSQKVQQLNHRLEIAREAVPEWK